MTCCIYTPPCDQKSQDSCVGFWSNQTNCYTNSVEDREQLNNLGFNCESEDGFAMCTKEGNVIPEKCKDKSCW